MIFLPLLLLLSSTAIKATFPELPDINSFMPNILEMVPMNGRLIFNDQVFNFGDPTQARASSPEDQTEVIESDSTQSSSVSNNLPQTPALESRASDLAIIPSNVALQTPNTPNSELQIPNNVNPVLQPPNNAPTFLISNRPNFASRIPNFGSSVHNFESLRTSSFNSQNPSFDSLPNVGSTELGSTFAENAKSNFRDEFSQPSGPMPVPTGLSISNGVFNSPMASQNVRPLFNPTESPLVVMPLIVSPDRLIQKGGQPPMSSTPAPIATLMASATNVDERRDFGKFSLSPSSAVSSTNDEKSSNLLNKVVSRESTFLLPPPTVTQTTSNSSLDPTIRTILEKHLFAMTQPKTTPNMSSIVGPTTKPVIPFKFQPVFRPQRIPTLAELDQTMAEIRKSQQMDSSVPTVVSFQSK